MITKDKNRKIWADAGLPHKKADSWFDKQQANNWTMPDGKKIAKPELMAKIAAEKLLKSMSASERKKYQNSKLNTGATIKQTDRKKTSDTDENLKEMFRLKMEGVGWVSEDGQLIINQGCYIEYLVVKHKIESSKSF